MCKWGPRCFGKGFRWAGGDFGDRVRGPRCWDEGHRWPGWDFGDRTKEPGNGMRDPDVRIRDLGGDPGIERRDSGGQERILVTE